MGSYTKSANEVSHPHSHGEGNHPDNIHKSLGHPIRSIAYVLSFLILVGATVMYYGLPGRDNLVSVFVMLAGAAVIFILVPGIRVSAQWELGVILLLGRYAGIRGPGIVYVIPGLESVIFIDMRLMTLEIKSQKVITKDNVPVHVDGAVFYKVVDPGKAINEVRDYRDTTGNYAQAALRDVVGGLSLDELLTSMREIQESIQEVLESRISAFGVAVESVRLLEVDVPEDLKRIMSRQAGAEREKRATITKAEGDKLAALNLAQAASTMVSSPGAMRLRALQTIDGLGASQANTIVLFPMEMLDLVKGIQELKPTRLIRESNGDPQDTETELS